MPSDSPSAPCTIEEVATATAVAHNNPALEGVLRLWLQPVLWAGFDIVRRADA